MTERKARPSRARKPSERVAEWRFRETPVVWRGPFGRTRILLRLGEGAKRQPVRRRCVGDQAGLPSCRQRGLQVAAGDQLQGMQLLAAILSAWPVILTGRRVGVEDVEHDLGRAIRLRRVHHHILSDPGHPATVAKPAGSPLVPRLTPYLGPRSGRSRHTVRRPPPRPDWPAPTDPTVRQLRRHQECRFHEPPAAWQGAASRDQAAASGCSALEAEAARSWLQGRRRSIVCVERVILR
jgi:hypothetical protein